MLYSTVRALLDRLNTSAWDENIHQKEINSRSISTHGSWQFPAQKELLKNTFLTKQNLGATNNTRLLSQQLIKSTRSHQSR
jgi:hypothetical protein